MATSQQSHAHHYVPQWYQREFLPAGQGRFYYLDLHPETIVTGNRSYTRRSLLRWGPAQCFFKNDLYSLKLGNWTSDQIETMFFGDIDRRGQAAVKVYRNYKGYTDGLREAFPALTQYMDAQRFRTPKGLDQLRKLTDVRDQNTALMVLQKVFRYHTTMWSEGVWEIVSARRSSTKFILTDEPVTFFNRRLFPSESVYPGDIELDKTGTRTLFPLGPEACLIITHTQLARNPRSNPLAPRENARAYDMTMRYLLDTQFDRELEEDEVLRTNVILKTRATRYIAAAREESLYPERLASTTDWAKLDNDWFLLPNLYKIHFRTGIVAGGDGFRFDRDEYGYSPRDANYQNKRRRKREHEAHDRTRHEWAKKRMGRSVAHIDDRRDDEIHDQLMNEYLRQEGLLPAKSDSAK
jgi:hypothetical protein